MSRQFDSTFEENFDLGGEEYSLIAPVNFKDLVKAMEVKSALETYISGMMQDEDSTPYESLLEEQNAYIAEYCDGLGEFDNSYLIGNINYYLRRYNLRMGEFEQMIGVSAGYISRTAKEDSGKKLSIDVAWKIARILGVDIRALIETDLSIPSSNKELIIMFLNKLRVQTQDKQLNWEIHGGDRIALKQKYINMGMISERKNGRYVYRELTSKTRVKGTLADDIVVLKQFDEKRDLAIIPYYQMNNSTELHFDCVIVYQEDGEYKWDKFIFANDDLLGDIDYTIEVLHHDVMEVVLDAKISPEVRDFMREYLQ